MTDTQTIAIMAAILLVSGPESENQTNCPLDYATNVARDLFDHVQAGGCNEVMPVIPDETMH